MKRGDVFWGTIEPRSGSEQKGRRPVIIVSNDRFNRNSTWRSVIVVPVTTSDAQRRRGPTAVFLPAGTGGLASDSVAVCHQVTTLDRSKLTDHIGELPDSDLEAVGKGLQIAQGLK